MQQLQAFSSGGEGMADEERLEGALTCGTVLDHFVESEELMSIVAALPQSCEELRSREKSEERFTSEDVCYTSPTPFFTDLNSMQIF